MKLTEKYNWENVHSNYKLPLIFNDKDLIGYQFKKIIYKYISNSGDFLEAGCAPGKFGAYFRKKGFNVYGFDYSPIGVEQTQLNWQLLDIDGLVKEADVLNLDGVYRKGSFDFVLSYGLIEHFEDPKKIILNLSELVKCGGILCTVIPNTCSKSLKMLLTKKFNYNKFKYIKATHKAMNLSDLIYCHDGRFNILSSKRIIGLHLQALRTNNDSVYKKTILYSLKNMQNTFKILLPFLQFNFLATHFICLAKKIN